VGDPIPWRETSLKLDINSGLRAATQFPGPAIRVVPENFRQREPNINERECHQRVISNSSFLVQCNSVILIICDLTSLIESTLDMYWHKYALNLNGNFWLRISKTCEFVHFTLP